MNELDRISLSKSNELYYLKGSYFDREKQPTNFKFNSHSPQHADMLTAVLQGTQFAQHYNSTMQLEMNFLASSN